tara:strand:- start:71386 stop:72228 length:843 start_codon:yes stop_codon:yes gene_type:complete
MTPLELLEKQNIQYRTSGRDFLIPCLNPEHEDANPSMRVDSITGVFHCFSCGFKGNILTRFNVAVSRLHTSRERLKDKLNTIRTETVGLSIPENAVFWEKDYRNISAETYMKFKAFTYDGGEFNNYLVFPIYDITGKISCFLGRNLDDFAKPKYKVYPSKAYVPIFPMKAKPIAGSIVLVEGIFDMLNLQDKGITNAMAAFGTQSVSEEKLKLLQLLGVQTIYVFFDGDEAGEIAAAKLKDVIYGLGMQSENIYWKDRDPGSLSATQIERLAKNKWPQYF